jgi:hypothetical protein
MKDNAGGRADRWGNHPGGDRMSKSKAELKAVPTTFGLDRPQNQGWKGEKGGKGHLDHLAAEGECARAPH